jgi:hypothetical protein
VGAGLACIRTKPVYTSLGYSSRTRSIVGYDSFGLLTVHHQLASHGPISAVWAVQLARTVCRARVPYL